MNNPVTIAIFTAAVSLVVLTFSIFAANWSNQRNTERLIEGLRQEMNAHAQETNARFASLEGTMNARFAALEDKLDARFDTLTSEIRRLDQRVDAVEKTLDQRMDLLTQNLDQRFDHVAYRFGQVEQRLDKLDRLIEPLLQPAVTAR